MTVCGVFLDKLRQSARTTKDKRQAERLSVSSQAGIIAAAPVTCTDAVNHRFGGVGLASQVQLAECVLRLLLRE
jgi:hypothetical protein